MNNNLKELIETLVYKTADSDGWAPQNKLGQYMARLGRSVKEMGYEKMSNFFQDHPDRFLVEKDEYGLPIVRLLGEPPVETDIEIDLESNYHPQPRRQYNGYQRQNGYNDYGRGGYGQQGYRNGGYGQQYGRGYGDRRLGYNGYRRPQEHLSLFRWAFFPDREEWLQMLADTAKEQVWQYEGGDPAHPNPALFDYLHDTFRRLQLEGKVLESRAEGIALFNSGLVDREEGRPIYLVFGPNPNRNRQPWLFQEFFMSSAPLIASSRAEQRKNEPPYENLPEETDNNYEQPLQEPDDDDLYYN